jgi:ferrochelatase
MKSHPRALGKATPAFSHRMSLEDHQANGDQGNFDHQTHKTSKDGYQRKVGVVLLNLGGPETLDDVGPFLYNLFADPEIIRIPIPFLQKPLAMAITAARTGEAKENYRKIGGGSPQLNITEQQAKLLEESLRQQGLVATTYVAMRYAPPFTSAVVKKMMADGVKEVVVLPLYPHYSISTSGSSFRELQRQREMDPEFASLPTHWIRSYFNNTNYIAAMADLISREIRNCPDPSSAHVFFSAHGVPRKYVEEDGDPYQAEIEASARLIMKRLADDLGYRNPSSLAYQSRVGPLEWLKPYTEDALQELGRTGVKDLVVVPISFVGEHIETLQEIDLEYREVALTAGIKNFRRVPTLGTSPSFIHALTTLVQESLKVPEVNSDQAADGSDQRGLSAGAICKKVPPPCSTFEKVSKNSRASPI